MRTLDRTALARKIQSSEQRIVDLTSELDSLDALQGDHFKGVVDFLKDEADEKAGMMLENPAEYKTLGSDYITGYLAALRWIVKQPQSAIEDRKARLDKEFDKLEKYKADMLLRQEP